MDTEISRWQDRLTSIEDRYWKQFTAMEKALSKMNSQSTWMQQSLFGGS
ncbi:flagellar filament capping protein FliD [Planococcus halocryophilus]|nr:flagellar filament capping protein FliD [Planococcus halocryophilus]